MASLASSSYRNSLSYILHPRVKCQHSAASHFIRRYFVLVRPAHARRRHVWPRQCLDETLTHTHTHTHNAPIGFGMWPSSSTGITTALVSPSPSFSFVSLFQDQDSTTCSLGPSTSPLRHTASCSGTMQHQRHRLALHHYPRLSPSDPRGPTPDAARQISSRRKAGGNRCPPDDPSELSDLQLHRRLRPGPPIEPEVSTACASLDDATSIGLPPMPCTGRHRRAAALQNRRTTGWDGPSGSAAAA